MIRVHTFLQKTLCFDKPFNFRSPFSNNKVRHCSYRPGVGDTDGCIIIDHTPSTPITPCRVSFAEVFDVKSANFCWGKVEPSWQRAGPLLACIQPHTGTIEAEEKKTPYLAKSVIRHNIVVVVGAGQIIGASRTDRRRIDQPRKTIYGRVRHRMIHQSRMEALLEILFTLAMVVCVKDVCLCSRNAFFHPPLPLHRSLDCVGAHSRTK
jgi:hypothetical protein